MSNSNFHAVSQDPAVIFNLSEGTEHSPEVDQEPIGDSSSETVVTDIRITPPRPLISKGYGYFVALFMCLIFDGVQNGDTKKKLLGSIKD